MFVISRPDVENVHKTNAISLEINIIYAFVYVCATLCVYIW